MNYFSKILLFFTQIATMSLIALSSQAAKSPTPLEKCLNSAMNETKTCAQRHITNLTLESCAKASQTIRSNYMRESFRSFCFYEISEFPSLMSCTSYAAKFIAAENHDAALFDCYRQFQKSINQKGCRNLAQKMRYPDKANYLDRHCDELVN